MFGFGIPPEEQPANHYRLLSIRLFETSGDVIDNAADRQMAHLRHVPSGKHGDLSQRLLNEVAAARICLLDPKKRAAYDQQLRAKLAATTARSCRCRRSANSGRFCHSAPTASPTNRRGSCDKHPDGRSIAATGQSMGRSARQTRCQTTNQWRQVGKIGRGQTWRE